jgi:hypothetical protein
METVSFSGSIVSGRVGVGLDGKNWTTGCDEVDAGSVL